MDLSVNSLAHSNKETLAFILFLVYHIHAYAVPADGNCSGTLGHLDPFVRGESPPCDPTQPQTCQVGDLSGKHGNITSAGTFQTT
jgi:hypothetical protein